MLRQLSNTYYRTLKNSIHSALRLNLASAIMPPKKQAKKAGANGYKMPDPIPAGMHLCICWLSISKT